MPGLTLDAGALTAFVRNDRRTVALISRANAHGHSLAVPLDPNLLLITV